MKYLVTGASGLVGYYFCKKLLAEGHDVIPLVKSHSCGLPNELHCDICNKDAIGRIMAVSKPDIVLHCAAMTGVDECELSPEIARKVNVDGTDNVCRAAKSNDARFAFISTSFVFGDSEQGLDENAPPAPINQYGLTKMLAEKCVASVSESNLILRIDQPFYRPKVWQKPDMVSRTISQLRANKPFSVFSDWFNQPTYLPDLVNIATRLILGEHDGIFHVVSKDRISRYEWAVKIAETFGFDGSLVQPVSSASSHLPAKRPSNFLKTDKVSVACGVCPRSIDAALDDLKTLAR
jgi:dTDP-4-dehydrorhamnose reductase